MGLMIWLVLIFKLRHCDIHPAQLWAFLYLVGSIRGCPNAPKKRNKPTTDIKIKMYGVEIFPVDEAKFLELTFDGKLMFKSHFTKWKQKQTED
jgi:hypothetical protein